MIRNLLRRALIGTLLLGFTGWAQAQDYPKGPINLVIPLAPGDAVDIAARTMAEELSRSLKVPVLVVNRPGAGGALATESIARAPKDGYTIGMTINAALTFRRVLDPSTATYDPARDFTLLGITTRTPSILAVRSDAPYATLREMIDYARANPGKVRIGTPGAGSAGDFNVATLNALAGINMTAVPFKGASPAITALRGGHIEGIALALGVVSGHLKSGTVKGILLSSKFPEFHNVPTLADLGYRQKLLGVWLAYIAPADLPAEVTRTLVGAIEKAATAPAIGEKLRGLGMAQEYAGPKELLAEIRDEHRVVEEFARKSGLLK